MEHFLVVRPTHEIRGNGLRDTARNAAVVFYVKVAGRGSRLRMI
jgi:hypothetical protein